MTSESDKALVERIKRFSLPSKAFGIPTNIIDTDLAALLELVVQLTKERDALREDAERYRAIANCDVIIAMSAGAKQWFARRRLADGFCEDWHEGKTLDAAIDAARSENAEG